MKERATAACALAAMVREKGSPTPEEVRFVAHSALELALDDPANEQVQEVLREGGDFAALLAEVTSVDLRRFLFRQIVTLALLDEHITEEEQSYIGRAAGAFGYGDKVVEEFVGWIRDGIEWEKRGAALMERM
jgi:hypothetical protein